MSLPAGKVLEKLGYQRGIVTGLLVMAGGALFGPAANTWAFLVALGYAYWLFYALGGYRAR